MTTPSDTEFNTDFSLRTVPDSWASAAEDGEILGDALPLRRKRIMPRIPTRDQPDMFTALLAGVAMAVAGGWAWFHYETVNGVQAPWLAPCLALLVAAAVRLGSGRGHPDQRAAVAAVIYLVTLLTVSYLVERYYLRGLFGPLGRDWAGDTSLLRNRFSHPETVLAWIIGFLLSIQFSYLGHRRTRSTRVFAQRI